MGFRFRRSFRIAPGIRLNLGSKSTSVRIGPKGLGYTISSSGKKRVTASVPGTGLSYSAVVSPGRGTRALEADAAAPSPHRRKANYWPLLVLVAVLVFAFNVFGNIGRDPGRAPIPVGATGPTTAVVTAPVQTGALTQQQAPDTPAAEAVTTAEIRFVTASTLNVRSAPSTSGAITGKVAAGQQVVVFERGNGWLRIQTSAGEQGWVSEQYTSLSLPVPAISRPAAVVQSGVAQASGLTCSPRRTCSQISSCEAARWFLANCSWGGRLDRDDDGRPCEAMC